MPDPLADLARFQALLPPGFPAVSECLKAGVLTARLRKGVLYGISSFFDPEEMAIEIDPDADREKIVAIAKRRTGVKVGVEEAFVWLLLHEIGHCLRREHVRTMQRRNLLGTVGFSLFFMDWIAVDEEERLADEYAAERYRKWKREKARG
jgi:hypothetical protein